MIELKLKEFTYDRCPDCGAGIRTAEILGEHTNGHQREQVTFKCGRVDLFDPCFMHVVNGQECRETDAYSEKVARRHKLLLAVAAVVRESDADEEFKYRLMRETIFLVSQAGTDRDAFSKAAELQD